MALRVKRILGHGQAKDAGQEKMGADIVTRFQGVNHNLAGTPTQNHSAKPSPVGDGPPKFIFRPVPRTQTKSPGKIAWAFC
jgi:hypothetical protein